MTGGKNNDQYTEINTTAKLTNLDTGVTYDGLLINSDAVHIQCDLFAVNGRNGMSGTQHYVSAVTTTSGQRTLAKVQSFDSASATLHLTSEDTNLVTGVTVTTSTADFQSGIMYTRNLV